VQATRWARRVALAATVAGLVGAAVAAVAGVVLADVFRPHAPGVEPWLLPEVAQRSDRWSDRHRLAGGAFLAGAAIGLPLLLWLLRTRRLTIGRAALFAAASAAALVAALVTLATRPLVEWDQLALWSVAVGEDIAGYWLAGFGGDVRFILVDGTEVSQDAYVPVLLVHLAAPVVGAAALVVVLVALLRANPGAEQPGPPLEESELSR
jgi:hypothetical protein